MIKVADSKGEVYFQECIPHGRDAESALHFLWRSNERVRPLLGYLGLEWRDLLPARADAPGVVAIIREFLEWGALLRLACAHRNRLILRDGLLRSVVLPQKVF